MINGLKFETVRNRWDDWEKAELFQNFSAACVGLFIIEINKEWILSGVSIVQANIPGSDAVFFLLVKVKANIHAVISRHSIVISLAIIFIASSHVGGIGNLRADDFLGGDGHGISGAIYPGKPNVKAIRKAMSHHKAQVVSTIVSGAKLFSPIDIFKLTIGP